MPDTFEIVRFDRFTLDPRRRELRADGKLVPIEGKKFDLLEFLVSRRDESVSRDEILAHVWGGRTVSEGSVTVQLHELRKALTRAGGATSMILTLPNQRYRFVGDMAEDAPPPALPPPAAPPPQEAPPAVPPPHPPTQELPPFRKLRPGWRPVWRPGWWVAGLALALLVLGMAAALRLGAPQPQRFSVVVLPFRNLSNDRNQDYLADAITDDLTADLAHIPGSTVIARESALAAAARSPQDIGHTLNVRYIVRGSLVPEGPSLHITAVLEDTQTGTQLWTDRFDQARDNPSATREDIVHRIASSLHVQLDQLESTRSIHDRPDNPSAQDLFFRARAGLDVATTREELSNAQAQLEGAIAKQPDFVDAKAELAWVLLRKATTMDDPDEDRDYARAKELVAQALADSRQNVMALSARAKVLQADGHCDEALPVAQHAIDIDSSSLQARSVLARCAQVELRFDDAAAQYETMLKLNPSGADNAIRYLALGYIRTIQGQFPQAIDLLDRAAAGEPGDPDSYAGMNPLEQARLMLIAAYELSGRTAEAASAYQSYARAWPGRSVWRVSTYFPKAWLGLDGIRRILAALQHAGMQHFADEHAPGLPAGEACGAGDFAPTPQTMSAGGVVLDTQAFLRLQTTSPPPLVIDVGRGAAVVDGAIWRDPAENANSAASFALDAAGGRTRTASEAPIVVLGDGPTGCAAYAAAASLVQAGYRSAEWFRGGEEALAAGGGKTQDRRSQ